MNFFKILCLFLLSSQIAYANTKGSILSNDSNNFIMKSHGDSRPFARSARAVDNVGKWYSVTPPLFPKTVSLSQMRNVGFKKGKIGLSNKGVEIKESGSYSVTFVVYLQNPSAESGSLVFPILVRNGHFNLDDKLSNIVGDIVAIPPTGDTFSLQGSGILKDVKRGEKLSLRITIAGGIETVLNVASWDISVAKL